ncbi:meiotic recombination directing protein [Starmerella bacillaris]|uniref:Meiotic recombination directing protein n=1 Tax=Starmerella bacillaris TaxID=1247836 RepID=A0AAV5RNW4_STABA|nr:meiotic recombination directing protein [Starmerella bacillaris]
MFTSNCCASKLVHSAWPVATNAVTTFVVVFVAYVVYKLRTRSTGLPFSLDMPEAAQPHWKGKRVSEMGLTDEQRPNEIRCLCPATGQLLGYVKALNAEEINVRVEAAHSAWSNTKWRNTTVDQRLEVLKTMLKFVCDHQDEVCRVACRDTGKTMIDAALGEVMVTLEKYAWIIKNAKSALKTETRPSSASLIMAYKGAEVRYQPLGVVCAMVSWNYPLHNLLGPVAAALATGNAIVVKCSEQVAWSSEVFVNIAKRALDMHGFDPDLVQIVTCWPDHADTLTKHKLIKHITFIGSRPVAHLVVKAASEPLTPVVVELGGKDPLIVLGDYTNYAQVASIIMRGAFQSAGQNCIGVERVILHKNVHDEIVGLVSERVREMRVGSSIDESGQIDMGALSNAAHLTRLENLVKEAVDMGAKLVHGGKRYVHPKYPLGIYFEPTLLTHVTPKMRIAQEEVFGPILLVLRPAESVEDCIDLANSTEFGLGASVFGRNKGILKVVTDRLRCGNVAVNDFATYHLCQLPFGGVDGSGYGKFGGAEGLRGLCIEKSVCYDRMPFVSTFIPRALDYPIPSVSKAWNLVKNINNIGYSESIWTKIKGIRRVLNQKSQK